MSVRMISAAGRRVARDRWMVSYADMVTLLFASFAALYASSVTPPQAANLVPTQAADTAAASAAPLSEAAQRAADAATARQTLAASLQESLTHVEGLAAVNVVVTDHGVVVSLPEAGAFAAGQADLSQAARRAIRALADVLRKESGDIRVEGHTDDTPIATSRFASNWELSAARATEVIRFLVAQGSIPPERLSAAGYGEFRPIAANDSPESRARNRRVDIVVAR